MTTTTTLSTKCTEFTSDSNFFNIVRFEDSKGLIRITIYKAETIQLIISNKTSTIDGFGDDWQQVALDLSALLSEAALATPLLTKPENVP